MLPPSLLLDFLALFIPAAVGLAGSYKLYEKKVSDRKKNTRSAFEAELAGTVFLDDWPREGPRSQVPVHDFTSTSVYENSGDTLGLLSEREVSCLVNYYTRAKAVRDVLRVHGRIVAEATVNEVGNDTHRSDREQGLRRQIDKLELTRQRALLAIQAARGIKGIPECGDRLAETHNELEETADLLLEYGLIEDSDEGLTFTQLGAQFFEGEFVLTGAKKQRDVLERDKSYFKSVWKGRLQKVGSIINKLLNNKSEY